MSDDTLPELDNSPIDRANARLQELHDRAGVIAAYTLLDDGVGDFSDEAMNAYVTGIFDTLIEFNTISGIVVDSLFGALQNAYAHRYDEAKSLYEQIVEKSNRDVDRRVAQDQLKG